MRRSRHLFSFCFDAATDPGGGGGGAHTPLSEAKFVIVVMLN